MNNTAVETVIDKHLLYPSSWRYAHPSPAPLSSKVGGFIHVTCGRTIQFSAIGVLCQEEYDVLVYGSLLLSPRSS